MARFRRRRFEGRETLDFLTLVPNIVTLTGLCAGLTAMRFALAGRYEIAATLLLFAAVIDGLDGLLARKLAATSQFGAELDSLSDFVCFGVAPGFLVFQFALSDVRGLGWVFVLIYVICCCLRLARFNVNRDKPIALGARPHFTGVPAPAGAMLALLPLALAFEGLAVGQRLDLLVGCYLGLVGMLMISRMPTLSPKAVRIPRERARFVLIGAVAVMGLVVTRLWLLVIVMDIAYLGLLAYGAVTHRRRRAERFPPA